VKYRAVLASPLGFLIGLSLGALGGGGSILAVPALVFVAGESPSAATSTSLVVVGVAAAFGAHSHWRHGRVRVGPGVTFGLVGVAGSLAGSALNRRLDGDVLLLGFAGLIVVAAWRMTAAPAEDEPVEPVEGGRAVAVRTRPAPLTRARLVRIVAAGTGVGFLTGLFGVGGGFVVVPALALLLEFPMPIAVGTSLLVIAMNSAVALAARAGAGAFEWGTTLVFCAAAVAGVHAGRHLSDRLDAGATRHAFAGLLLAVAAYTGTRAVLALL